MMFSIITLTVTLLTLIDSAFSEIYKLRAFKLGHPLNGADINASGRAFYTSLAAPATYCPAIVNPNCPNNTLGGTIFTGFIGLFVSPSAAV